jgi:hypothetical protein
MGPEFSRTRTPSLEHPPDGEYINFFAGTGTPRFKNLKVVAGHLISDGTSNVSLYGGLAVTSNLEVGSSNLFVDTVNSRVGVGTTTPEATLHVSGNAYVSSNLEVGSSNLFVDTVNSRVGVGTTEPKESLDVVGNMHLTRVSNVSQIKVDSNVVTEYTGPHDRPLRKYPEVALTENSDKGYVASASSSLTANPAYLAFDGSASTFWHTQFPYYTASEGVYEPGNDPDGAGTYSGTLPSHELVSGYAGEYITLSLPNKIKMSKISINTRYDGNLNLDQTQSAEVIVVVGSHDGSNWEFVDTHTVGKYPDDNTIPYTFNVNTSTYYEHVGLICTNTGPTDSVYNTAWSMSKLAFYGHEEGSGSLDTTLKSVYNVPATTGTQLEVYYDAKDLADGNAPTNPVDLSPNTNNATLGGDPQVSNGAFVFDGSGDAVISGATSFSGSPTLSYSVWFKTNSILSGTGSNSIVMIGHAASTKSLGFRIKGTGDTNPGNYRFYVFGGATNESVETGIAAVLGRWTHATIVRDGLNMKLYIDGKFAVENTNTTTTLNLDSSAKVALGNYIDSSGTVTTISANDSYDGSIANFRLYSKALNADQIKELYDYQKDYFLGSKSQVTLYKGHLGVGVTEPSGQLELAGGERIQEYPPRGMTDFNTYIEGHGVFKASATSHGGSIGTSKYHAWKAFNKDRTDANNGDNSWLNGPDISGGDYNTSTGVYEGTEKHHGGAPIGAALQLSMPYEIYLKGYSLAPWNYATGTDFQYADSPSDFIIYGSKDNVNWVQIDSRTGQGMSSQTDIKRFSLDTRDSYSHFAIVVTKNNTAAYPSTSASFVAIEEWRLFGTPGPTTLDKGSLSLTRSLDVPRVSRYDVDTETPRPEKLVLDLDTTVNSSPTDISGRGNHGAFKSNCTYFPADKAFDFPGDGDRIDGCTFNGYSGPVIQSHSYWVKGATVNVRSPVTVGRAIGGTSGEYLSLLVDTGGWQINADGWSHDYDETIDTTRWYHVVVTYDGGSSTSSYKLYIDGEYKTPTGSNGTFGSLSLEADTVIRIGRDSGVGWFTGMISNIKIYDVALEPSEVKKLYNLGRTGRSMVISDTAVGIGKVPEAQLDVRGTARFGDVMVNGVIKSTVPSWHMYNTDTIHTGTLNFTENMVTPQNCSVSLSTGRVTITTAGRYCVSFHAFTEDTVAAGTGCQIAIMKSGTTYVRNYHIQPVTGVAAGPIVSSSHGATGGLTAIMDLAVNDYVEVNTNFLVHYNIGATFSGFMIG